MKILMMVLVMGLMGCVEENFDNREKIQLSGAEHFDLVEVYRSVDYETYILTSPDIGGLNGRPYQFINFYSDNGHFEVSFDVYTKDTHQFKKGITINSIEYDYNSDLHIKDL